MHKVKINCSVVLSGTLTINVDDEVATELKELLDEDFDLFVDAIEPDILDRLDKLNVVELDIEDGWIE